MFEKSTAGVIRLNGKAMAYHSLGNEKESNAAMEALIARHSHDGAFQIAQAYAWRGDKDAALQWLERAQVQRGAATLTPSVENATGRTPKG